MLIRSQNKKDIYNLKIITSISVLDYEKEKEIYDIIAVGCDGCPNQLGSYFTEEKAIKVLDMIQMYYVSMCELKEGYNPHVSISLFDVFQMPQDNEVEV